MKMSITQATKEAQYEKQQSCHASYKDIHGTWSSSYTIMSFPTRAELALEKKAIFAENIVLLCLGYSKRVFVVEIEDAARLAAKLVRAGATVKEAVKQAVK